jgi:heat shock protein HslJ
LTGIGTALVLAEQWCWKEIDHGSSPNISGHPGCRFARWYRALQAGRSRRSRRHILAAGEVPGRQRPHLRPDDKAKYTIAFGTDGRLSARIDCNRGNGTWKSSGPPQLEFGPLALTRAMCPPGSLHDRIVKHWPYVRSYVIKDGHLFLSLMADGGIYEFEPASQEERAATEPLENTYWKLVHLGDAPVAVAPRQSEPHLILNSVNRRAGGSGGCNRFTGSYERNGDRLRFGPMIATLMACAEGMETEKAFLDTLGRVHRWRITGQQLELLDAAGNVVARFEARHMG